MKKTIFAFLVVMLGFGLNAQAQRYSTGIGARFGYYPGLTVKHFLGGNNAIEGILSTRWNGWLVTGLYEFQNPLKPIPEIDWYIGIGGHIGFWDRDKYDRWEDDWDEDDNVTVIGIDFVLGLEYKFEAVPFTIGADWKPAVNILPHTHTWGDGGDLHVRFTF